MLNGAKIINIHVCFWDEFIQQQVTTYKFVIAVWYLYELTPQADRMLRGPSINAAR